MKIIPRAAENEIIGWQDDILRIKLKAPPVDGRANAELIKVLAKELNVHKHALEIISGATSRLKLIKITDSAK